MKLAWGQALILFLFSLFIAGTITPLVRKLAIRLKVVDRPNEAHKTQSAPVPYLGGLSVVMGVVVTTYVAILLSSNFQLLGLANVVLLPAIFMGIIGLIDDIKKLSPWSRFLVQNTVGLAISSVLVSTNTLGAPTGNRYLDLLITTFWIVGITNSINFFDNIDGGASGTVAISSMFLFLLAFHGGQYVIAGLSIVLSGATTGFLIWNKAPARIYMGDAGALFLGVLIASLTLRFDPKPIDKFSSFAIPVLLLAVPILDTTVAVISRLKRRISPFQGGQDHLAHRLMNFGLSKRKSVFILWGATSLFSFLAILISSGPFGIERGLTVLSLALWLVLYIVFSKMQIVTSHRN